MVSTALPTIVQDLGGNDFVWVGSAYALAGSAIVPLCGGLVSIWGRKPILLILTTLMAIGSAVSGSAKSLIVLIIGRGILKTLTGFNDTYSLTVSSIPGVWRLRSTYCNRDHLLRYNPFGTKRHFSGHRCCVSFLVVQSVILYKLIYVFIQYLGFCHVR